MFKRIRDSIADYFRETDKVLLLLCMAAACYGAVIILSATFISSGYSKFFVQLMGIALGVVAALLLSLFQYQTFLKYWYLIAGAAVFLVVLTFFIGYAPAGTDDKAWIALPMGLTFQPSELLKIAFTITFTKHVTSITEKDIRKLRHILLLCVHGAVPVLLIHFQGDDGSAMVLAFIFLAMFFAAGVPGRYFAIAGESGAVQFCRVMCMPSFSYVLLRLIGKHDRIRTAPSAISTSKERSSLTSLSSTVLNSKFIVSCPAGISNVLVVTI